MMIRYCGLLLLAQLIHFQIAAQGKDTNIFALPIQLDEFVLKATHEGWDIEAFIKRIKEDTTFYKAFRSLHIVPFISKNDIKIYDKNGNIAASLISTTRQNRNENCRTMDVLEEKTTGDFYDRKGEYNYYTAELYASLFFTEGKICGEDNIVTGKENIKGKGQLEKHKWQLKQLIFNPGSKVGGVPFAGNKVAIFDPDIAKMYNFKLILVEYSGEDCYLFTAQPKPEYKNEVIYNELTTWFRKSDYTIMARDYALSYRTLLYDFNVKMKVRLDNIKGVLLPVKISYDGSWDIALKQGERARFTTVIDY